MGCVKFSTRDGCVPCSYLVDSKKCPLLEGHVKDETNELREKLKPFEIEDNLKEKFIDFLDHRDQEFGVTRGRSRPAFESGGASGFGRHCQRIRGG